MFTTWKDNPENINQKELQQKVDAFLDNGFKYFDTSYVYHNGKSEPEIKEALVERYPREAYYLDTKLPTFLITQKDQIDEIFNKQLENTGVDYFDYYLLHNLNEITYDSTVTDLGMFEYAKQKKDEGKIKNLGISVHDQPEVLDRILTEHIEGDFVQIVVNYFDWDSDFIKAKENYDIIRKHDKKVVIMEPVKGGLLASKLPEETVTALEEIEPGMSLES